MEFESEAKRWRFNNGKQFSINKLRLKQDRLFSSSFITENSIVGSPGLVPGNFHCHYLLGSFCLSSLPSLSFDFILKVVSW